VESVSCEANGVRTLTRAPKQAFANLATGVTWTVGVLGGLARNCPAQQIVLAGFLAGAMVMQRVLHDLGKGASGRAILARVAAAILVGMAIRSRTTTKPATGPRPPTRGESGSRCAVIRPLIGCPKLSRAGRRQSW